MAVVVNDVLDAIAAVLKLADRTSLASWWTPIATDALSSGDHDIRSALTARGYSSDQISAWPDLDQHVKQQALYWSLVRGGSLEAFDEKLLDKLDQRDGMKTLVMLDASGQLVSAVGSITRGKMKSADDTFLDSDGTFKGW